MTTDCSICCETFNKSTRKPVECLDCNNVCCRECHQTYLFSRDVIDCMFCQEPHTFEHIKNSHYDTFIKSTGAWKGKGYREHQEEVYFKNEMAMFPETQKIIERDQVRDKIFKENQVLLLEISRITCEIKNDKKERLLKCNCKKGPSNCICVSVKERNDWLKNKEIKLGLIEDLREKREENLNILRYPKNIPSKIKVIEKCMATDCDGFLNSNWKCNKCDKITCRKCREIKTDGHVCDEDTVKTIQLAIRTSKPCPKCNERIHRIYGCDQVYCPLCKIVFSYSTGKMQIGGVIHQPDAVNELRKNGRLHRDIRDIPCGGVAYILDALRSRNKDITRFPICKYPKFVNIVRAILRWCIGYEDYQVQGQMGDNNLLDLNKRERYSFLTGQWNKEKFKKKIYDNYKNFEKYNEIRIIKAGFYVCVADMLRSLEGMKGYQNIYEHISQIFELSINYNKEFERVNKLYCGNSGHKLVIFMDINGHMINNVNLPKLYFGILRKSIMNSWRGRDRYDLNINNFLKYEK